jgi:AraC-like DNA-binding protein
MDRDQKGGLMPADAAQNVDGGGPRAHARCCQIIGRGTAFYAAGAALGPRVNESHLFVRVIEGSVRLTLDGSDIDVLPGQLLYSPAGSHETWQWDRTQPTIHDFVHWRFAWLPPSLPAPAAWPRLQGVPRAGLLQTLFDHLLDLDYRSTPQRQLQQEQALDLMVTTFVHGTDARRDAAAEGHDAVERVLDELGRRWARQEYRPPSIEEMCRFACLSKPHLTRVFGQACGLPPARFCECLRLHRGAHQLVSSTAPVAAIADQLGYATQFHFSRNFKRVYGLPPLRFRQRLRHHPEALSDQPRALLGAYLRVQHFSRFGKRAMVSGP